VRRVIGPVAIVVLLGCVTAGCGSSTKSGTGSAATARASTGVASANSSNTGSDGATNASCVSKVEAAVKRYEAPVPLKLPPTKIDFTKLKGKTIWMIEVNSEPSVTLTADGFADAASVLGIHTKILNGEGVTQTLVADVSSAVAQHADGIILYAIPLNLIGAQLAQAKAAGIPVIQTYNGDPGANDAQLGVFGSVDANRVLKGDIVSDWMMATSKCHLQAGMLGDNELAGFEQTNDAATANFAAMCGTNCTTQFQSVDLTSMATSAGPQAVNLLRANPNMKYIFEPTDGMTPFVLSSLKSAGLESGSNVIAADPSTSSFAILRAGNTPLKAEVGPPTPDQWSGYAFMDQIARAMLHMKPANWTLPLRLIDSSNIGTTDAGLFPAYANYKAAFLKAWGVSG
jgi:ribose transport system substrate-binding protein